MKLVGVHRLGFLLEGPASADEVFTDVGVVGSDHAVVERFDDLVERFLRLEVQDLPAVHAEVLLTRSLLLATGAGERRDLGRVGVAGLDVLPHHRGEGSLLRFASEGGDVAGDRLRAADAPLSILDERLGLPLDGEPVGVRLPEVRRRDGFVDVDATGGLLEALEEALVGEPFGRRELGPEVVLATAGVLGEPAVEVGDRHDQVDVVGATLPVDADLQGVPRVRDVPDLHVIELPAAEPTLELDSEQRLVARVLAPLDHRDDVGVPVEHVGLVGCGVVVPTRLGRDPVVGVGDVLAAGEVLRPDAERDAIVAVGLLATVLDVVGVVDPADDLLRRVLAGVERRLVLAIPLSQEGLVEGDIGVLADPDQVPEDLFVTGVAVVLATDAELVAELEQQFAVAFIATSLAVLEAIAHALDRALPVNAHTSPLYRWDVKGRVELPSSAYFLSFTVPQRERSAAGRSPVEGLGSGSRSQGVSA